MGRIGGELRRAHIVRKVKVSPCYLKNKLGTPGN